MSFPSVLINSLNSELVKRVSSDYPSNDGLCKSAICLANPIFIYLVLILAMEPSANLSIVTACFCPIVFVLPSC